MTTAQTRYDAAVRKALDIIAETSDGDRSDKLFRAGVHVGKFAHWQCADPGIAQRLFHEARASGAKDDAIGHIERGIIDGRKSPNAEPAEKVDEKPRETMAELFDRKRISRGVIAAYGIREYQGALYYPVPPMPVERIRFLTKPADMRWRRPGLDGVPVQLPYGLSQLRGGPSDPIYVVNGESGVWAGWTAGLDCVCFCRGEGAAPSETQARALAETGRPIRIVYDLDRPGERGSAKVAAALTAAGCVDVRNLLLPEDLHPGNDFGDLWVKCGADKAAFRALLESLPERGAAVAKPPTEQPDLPTQDLAPVTCDYLNRACPGIPAPKGVKVPYGYIISSEGVHKLPPEDKDDEMPRLICGGPVAVVGYSRDKDLGTMTCTIAYRRPHDPTWYTHECDRATLMEARKVSGLSAVGVPVTSGQAASLVQYFAVSEAALSQAGVAVTVTTSAMGWHGNTFVRGYHSHGDAPRLKLPGNAGALHRVAECIGTKGDFAEWKKVAWPIIQTRPTLLTMLAASVFPIIRHVIGCPMFALDICGETSVGKTTGMMVAASVWGQPGNSDNPGYMRTWEGTRVAIETLAGAMRGMPLLLDDTRRQKVQSDCAQIVYDIVAGEGRARGAKDGGMRAMAVYDTVLLSTGEGPLKDMIAAGGLTARCLTLWGAPMGGESVANAETADLLADVVSHHYGHIAELMIEWVRTSTADSRGNLLERYHRYLSAFRAMLPPDAPRVAYRQAKYAAGLSAAGKVLAWVAGLDPKTRWITPEAWGVAAKSSATADRATAALQDLASHVAVNSGRVYVPRKVPSSHVPDPTAPHQGWIAHRVPDGALSVPVTIAREFLTRAGYACVEVIASWRERGWIESSSPRGTRSVRFGEQVVTCYSLTAAALAIAAGQDSGATDPAPDDDDTDNPLAF